VRVDAGFGCTASRRLAQRSNNKFVHIFTLFSCGFLACQSHASRAMTTMGLVEHHPAIISHDAISDLCIALLSRGTSHLHLVSHPTRAGDAFHPASSKGGWRHGLPCLIWM